MNTNTFERKLVPDILQHISVNDISQFCTSSSEYQQLCQNQELWRYLLYRDYSTFSPIITSLERESYMSYLDLYKEFRSNLFFNSPDFKEFYSIMLNYVPIVIFIDEELNQSPIPRLISANELLMNTSYLAQTAMRTGIRFHNFDGSTEDLVLAFLSPAALIDSPFVMSSRRWTGNAWSEVIATIPVTVQNNRVSLKKFGSYTSQ